MTPEQAHALLLLELDCLCDEVCDLTPCPCADKLDEAMERAIALAISDHEDGRARAAAID